MNKQNLTLNKKFSLQYIFFIKFLQLYCYKFIRKVLLQEYGTTILNIYKSKFNERT